MRRKSPYLAALLIAGCVTLAAAEGLASGPVASAPPESKSAAVNAALSAGVEAFGAERYRDALDRFASVLADPKASEVRPTAAYWSILSYLALGDQAAAESAIDSYLATWPEGDRAPDLMYQKGRILYQKGGYEGALTTFSSFIAMSPGHSLVPSALYWGAECLFALGRLEDADKVFKSVVDRYPTSVKVEAANYKRGLIALESRERELLKLLSWSHEESIRAADDFRSREKTYEDALDAYQRQLTEAKQALSMRGDSPELKAQVADLQSRLAAAQASLDAARADLEKARAEAAAQAAAAQAAVAAAQGDASKAEAAKATVVAKPSTSNLASEFLTSALDAKKRALDLLSFYIDRLSPGGSK